MNKKLMLLIFMNFTHLSAMDPDMYDDAQYSEGFLVVPHSDTTDDSADLTVQEKSALLHEHEKPTTDKTSKITIRDGFCNCLSLCCVLFCLSIKRCIDACKNNKQSL